MVTPGKKGMMPAICLLLVALVGAAAAGPFEEGFEAFKRGDYPEAMRWWRKAAERGDTGAQFNLGYMYAKGQGVPQDYAEAMRWYRKAAEQGVATAQAMLGLMFYKDKDVPQDYAEAMWWFQKAAEQGNAGSQLNIGVMYTNGQGVSQDYVQAHKWFSLAASRFSASEAEERDLAVQYRNRVAAKMTPVQIAKAQKLAREWQPE